MNIKGIAIATVVAGILTAVPGTAHAASGVRVWFHPGGQFAPATLWKFDFDSGAGFKRSYQPSLTGWPVQRQTDFTFEKSGAEYTLHTFVYGGTQRITGLDYSASADTWVVSNNGYTEKWLGCRSAGRPLYAAVAC
ncbi:hypothetical protein ACQP2E_14025 [Actinoplanes sp. CA-015351]|uniref:hypothetical protein n=1 Tax=Actinoplanes sp. CA-015351 TaxID=3239897 RepID=UPI003D954B6A